MLIFDKDIYDQAFINPFKNEKVTDLSLVSAFCKPGIITRHFHDLNKIKKDKFNLKIFLGYKNTSWSEHVTFNRIMEVVYPGRFQCYYYSGIGRVHSKVYQWNNDENKGISFLGSANYSSNGIINTSQKEILYRLPENHNQSIREYINEIIKQSVLCTDPEAAKLIKKKKDKKRIPFRDEEPDLPYGKFIELPPYNGYPGVRQSLLDIHGELPLQSGPNWGQGESREELNRDPNQAYIKICAELQRMDFFPSLRGEHFLVQDLDDENIQFIGRSAGDGVKNEDGIRIGKQIESPESNTIIGKYFRRKLGVRSGELVTLQHLRNYGKTYVDFYKVDDETYIINF